MKIRNKQTGDVWDIPKMRHPTVQEDDISFFAVRDGDGKLFSYPSIAELNADWEDYTPKEPLIKDEKIRKAVRAWAEGNHITSVHYDAFWKGFRRDNSSITVWEELPLEDNNVYTIAELCGEEEE